MAEIKKPRIRGCPREALLILSKKKDFSFLIRYYTSSDITDESLPEWKRKGGIKSYHSVLKKYEMPFSKERSLVRLIFRITLGLILQDIINLNYSFQFPHINGGQFGIFDIHNPEAPLRRTKKNFWRTRRVGYRYCRAILVNFQRQQFDRRIYKVRLAKKYHKMMIKKIINGHTYPQKNAK
jgi:hypothetical protein